MKIYTIFTGGTIGSRLNEEGQITTKNSSPYILLDTYEKKYHSEIRFVVEEPYYILSENLSAVHIKKLVRCVSQGLQDGTVDGIIVTHGTDTLQYSAALLAYLFGDAGIPIVLVSADYPLGDWRSNGLYNFRFALDFIKNGHGSGVFVCYFNQGDFPVIHRGTRLLQHLPFSADLVSVYNSWYGRFESGCYVKNPEYRVRKSNVLTLVDASKAKLTDASNEIMRITPYVGMAYPKLSGNIKAVLLESFHSGTIAVNDALKQFMKDADGLGIPVFLTGLSETEAQYETVSHYQELGVRPLRESAPIAQYCKLWLAVSNEMNLLEIMNCSVAEDWV